MQKHDQAVDPNLVTLAEAFQVATAEMQKVAHADGSAVQAETDKEVQLGPQTDA